MSNSDHSVDSRSVGDHGGDFERNVNRADAMENASLLVGGSRKRAATEEIGIVCRAAKGESRLVETLKTVDVVPPSYAKYVEVDLPAVVRASYDPEAKRLPAVLLHVKKGESLRGASIYPAKGIKSTQSLGFSNEATYDRLLLFGCLGSGNCFVVMTPNARISGSLLQHLSKENMSVGQTVFLLEPTFDGKTLGKEDMLPIVEVEKPLKPHIFKNVPERSFAIPVEPGSNFFYLHHAQVHVSIPIMMHGSCCGYLCDGQPLRGNERSCGCLFNRGHSLLVLSMGVTVMNSSGVKEIFSMRGFRSWMMTEMFVPDLGLASKLDDFVDDKEVVLRQSIRKVLRHVNRHGGWDVVGWMRRGVQVDAAEKDKRGGGEEVAAESISPHIIRLMPTSLLLDSLVTVALERETGNEG